MSTDTSREIPRAQTTSPARADARNDTDAAAGPHCRNCGAAISPRVARVIGDNDRTVAACKHCAEPRDGRRRHRSTTAAALAVRRRERGR